jgi:NhaP-type Na+/H+ and K+/H+ antiporters
VAQTVMSESAFNDAMGAIVTFGVLAVATGSGEFSFTASLVDLVKQSPSASSPASCSAISPPC